MRNLNLENIAKAVNGKIYNANDSYTKEVEGVVIDSRLVKKDYLFVCIKGERADGHDFVKQVYESGAMAVITEKELKDINDKPYILVESTLKALKDLAEYYRENLDIKVVGITGSVGKTSTKEFIASVLKRKYNVLKTAGNFNNEIGLPLTVFNIRDEHEIAVLEMGISDFDEMNRLSKVAKPDVCVLTNIGLCHLENLKSREGILKAKTEMFNYAKDSFKLVINGDDDMLSTIDIPNEKYVYGIDSKKDIYAEDVKLKGIFGSECKIVTKDGTVNAKISIPGKHMIYNAMAATAVGKAFGLSEEEIEKGIEELENVGGRLNIIQNEKYTIIDDCYNANPISTKSSIDVLTFSQGRKVCILGDMFELGKNEEKLHYDLGEYIAGKDIEAAVFIGKLSENTYKGVVENDRRISAYHFDNIEGFIENKSNILKEKDTLLVKASHSMHFEKIVEALK